MKNVISIFVTIVIMAVLSIAQAEECNGWWVFGRFEADQVRVDQCTNDNDEVGYYIENLTEKYAIACVRATLKDDRVSGACTIMAASERLWVSCKECSNIDKFEMVKFATK